MKKLYEKSEICFSVFWIVVYTFVMGNLSGNFGDDSIFTLLGLCIIAGLILIFIYKNKLQYKYGFVKVKHAKKYLYFLPILILSTINLWYGITMHYEPMGQIIAVINMAIVGVVEEVIFRGFLFKAIEKDNVKEAIVISAVTFGIGHIVNLLTGQATLETILQVFYAIAFGFAFVMMFYKSGSLLPCILAHSLIDVTSTFSNTMLSASQELMFNYIGSIIVIIVAGLYSYYLNTLKNKVI